MAQPLVSVIVRTCQRPEILKIALNSIRGQTYQNIQVVVVEDGENTAENMIRSQYSDLRCIYEATGKKVGRCKAGNRAMELASGDFFNFLDDDDAFFPNHVECLVAILQKNQMLAAYSIAEERQVVVKTANPYQVLVKRKTVRYSQEYNRLLLYSFNYIPIQCMMFHRSLYEMLGGLDETLDNLEDWDLWVRYSMKTDYVFVDQVTSCYHVPCRKSNRRKRSNELNDYLVPLYNKFKTYNVRMNIESINREMNYVIREYKNKGLLRYLRMFFRAVFYGEK